MSLVIDSPWPRVKLPETSVWDLVWSNPNKISDDKAQVIDGSSGRVWTRKQLREAGHQVAWGYRNRLKLEPGAVICIFSPNSFYYHLLVLASQCAGCVLSGANAAYTPSELQHQLSDSAAAVILCHPQVLETALAATSAMGWTREHQQQRIVLAVQKDETGPAGDIYKSISDLMVKGKSLQPHKIASPKTTVAYLGYSSGTSGKAKGVRTSVHNMTSVLSILGPIDVTSEDVHMAVLPLNHIYGLTKLLHWPVLTGCTVVIQSKFELNQFCALVERYKITCCMLVPPIALLLARDPVVNKYNMKSLRLIISGAAPMGKELSQELEKRWGSNVVQAYGLTETSPTTHYCPIRMNKSGSIGPLLPMMRARIVDPDSGKDQERNKPGELWLQGPNVMLGYLNRPEANAETLLEDDQGRWLKTGDIAVVDDEGFFYITDRLKELIKVKGFQVPPAELEAVLLECPFVNDVAVIGIYHEDQATEFPRAYVVPSPQHTNEKDLDKKIIEWVSGKVAAHKRLRGGVRFLEAIPKSPSGKLLRRELRVLAARDPAPGSSAKL
ncbi:hypothetical protein OIO90_002187 [Microbotryomycetes sp. JL221]|nr:hypothetical protein OIO90_002187 [Microbotryomycetes sp. JL221]